MGQNGNSDEFLQTIALIMDATQAAESIEDLYVLIIPLAVEIARSLDLISQRT